MLQCAVWEDNEGLAAAVARLAGGAALVRAAREPAQLSGQAFDLLVISPGAPDFPGAGEVRCRCALVPGGRARLTRALRAERLLSYGTGGANTLTISGLRQGRASVCVQREFTALSGAPVERQELVLPYDGLPPELYLARVGTLLLLYGKADPLSAKKK